MFEIVWNHQPVITFRHYFNGLSCEHPGREKLPVSGALLAACRSRSAEMVPKTMPSRPGKCPVDQQDMVILAANSQLDHEK